MAWKSTSYLAERLMPNGLTINVRSTKGHKDCIKARGRRPRSELVFYIFRHHFTHTFFSLQNLLTFPTRRAAQQAPQLCITSCLTIQQIPHSETSTGASRHSIFCGRPPRIKCQLLEGLIKHMDCWRFLFEWRKHASASKRCSYSAFSSLTPKFLQG